MTSTLLSGVDGFYFVARIHLNVLPSSQLLRFNFMQRPNQGTYHQGVL